MEQATVDQPRINGPMEKGLPKKRRSRYKTLSKTKRSPLVLQQRDIDIAKLVHEHYQLNSHHIRALVRGLNLPAGRGAVEREEDHRTAPATV